MKQITSKKIAKEVSKMMREVCTDVEICVQVVLEEFRQLAMKEAAAKNEKRRY